MSEAVASGIKFKGLPKKISNQDKQYLNAIFYKTKINAKIHDIQNSKSLNRDRLSNKQRTTEAEYLHCLATEYVNSSAMCH